MEKVRKDTAEEGDLVVTDFQSKGRGQRGNVWSSEEGKNLLVSICLKPAFLEVNKTYLINVVASVGMKQALSSIYPGGKVEIKWPNDIYINDKKVAGILVESVIVKNRLESVIVGIGLNVNQSHFHMNTATSLYLELGTRFDRHEVLEEVLQGIEQAYIQLSEGRSRNLLHNYHDGLRWRGEIHQYQSKEGLFKGEIVGIDHTGSLMINVNGKLCAFEVKEIAFFE